MTQKLPEVCTDAVISLKPRSCQVRTRHSMTALALSQGARSLLRQINYLFMDMKDQKMTVIGTADPTKVVDKLRKRWNASVITIGPKEEPVKTEDKKEKPQQDSIEHIEKVVTLYLTCNPYSIMHYIFISREEDPNSCAIC
ncbi:heavy metal-associated isoprenylated plant protein 39-like [Wolffia australiana]